MVFDVNDPTATEVIQTYLKCARDNSQTIGLTSGAFDLIHFHHFLYFIRCRRECDILIVGVDSDELVREYKGDGRPIVYDSRRVVMVDALKPVTFAFIMNSLADFGSVAKITSPDVIFKSDAFLGHEDKIVGKEYAKRIKIVRDVTDHASTTQILQEATRITASKRP